MKIVCLANEVMIDLKSTIALERRMQGRCRFSFINFFLFVLMAISSQ
jgi:hypothetical protein